MDRRTVATVLWATLALACGLQPPPPEVPPDVNRGPGYAPARWFHSQRASAGRVPPMARSRALAAAREAGLGDAPGTWMPAGPDNVGGRVTAIAVDPVDPLRIWVGTAAGGVFLTEDEGVTFTPVFDDQVALAIGDIVAHPSDPDVVYVATGEDNGGGLSYDGEGVFKTTDGGQTWIPLGLAEVRRIGKLAIDPTDGDRVFAAAGGDWFTADSHRGIYRTEDGGATWEQVLYVAADAGGCEVVIHPTDPDVVFAAVWQRLSQGDDWTIAGPAGGIYRSLDGGDTWTKQTAGLPVAPGRIGLAFAPSEPDWIYANIINGFGTLDGLYRSVDGGETWTRRGGPSIGGFFSVFSYYFSQIRVNPHYPDAIYALDQRLLFSTDGGLTVTRLANEVHVDWHALIVEPGGRVLAGTDGGFYVSQDGFQNWFHSKALPITQFYDLGIDRLNPDRRFGGAQDNGTQRTTDAGATPWSRVLGGDGLQTEVDYTDSSKVYASAQYGHLARSLNGGDLFILAMVGIADERTHWNAPYVLDPVVPSTLYTATFRVYRSLDSAENWAPISPDLTDGPTPSTRETDHHDHDHDPEDAGRGLDEGRAMLRGRQDHLENLVRGTVTVVRPSPVNPGVIWAGTDDGHVWVTASAGLLWRRVDPPGLGYWVTDIAADPTVREAAYVAVTGYREGDRMPYVRATEDLGVTWNDVTGNLPQVPVNTLALDPAWRGRLFAGNDLGVYVSDDGGGTWSAMRGGMPHVVVADLVLHDPGRTLFAGTFARSMYTYDLDQLPPADGDADGIDNNADCAPFDPGAFGEPPEVGQLMLDRSPAGEALLSWRDSVPLAGAETVYDLAVAGQPSSESWAALACGVPDPFAIDGSPASEGESTYYLVRARNVCSAGPWGRTSNGAPRAVAACP